MKANPTAVLKTVENLSSKNLLTISPDSWAILLGIAFNLALSEDHVVRNYALKIARSFSVGEEYGAALLKLLDEQSIGPNDSKLKERLKRLVYVNPSGINIKERLLSLLIPSNSTILEANVFSWMNLFENLQFGDYALPQVFVSSNIDTIHEKILSASQKYKEAALNAISSIVFVNQDSIDYFLDYAKACLSETVKPEVLTLWKTKRDTLGNSINLGKHVKKDPAMEEVDIVFQKHMFGLGIFGAIKKGIPKLSIKHAEMLFSMCLNFAKKDFFALNYFQTYVDLGLHHINDQIAACIFKQNNLEVPECWKEPCNLQTERIIGLLADQENKLNDLDFAYSFPLFQYAVVNCIALDNILEIFRHQKNVFLKDCALVILDIVAGFPKFSVEAGNILCDICMSNSDLYPDDLLDVIMNGLLKNSSRNICLKSLEYLGIPNSHKYFVFMCIYSEEGNLASHLFEMNDLDIENDFLDYIFKYLKSKEEDVREMAAKSIAAAVLKFPETLDTVLKKLYTEYEKLLITVEYDQYGIATKKEDFYEARVSIARCLGYLKVTGANTFFPFLIKAFSDRNYAVRVEMLAAGLKNIRYFSNDIMDYLEEKLKDIEIRDSICVLLGEKVKGLEISDPRISQITDVLIETLKTPSESVQLSICTSLVGLIGCSSKKEEIIEGFLKGLSSTMYAIRKGSAYGLAGVVKGLRLPSLKKFKIMERLLEMVKSKNPDEREGTIFAFEALSGVLGYVFEPYVMQVVPCFLNTFGDGSQDIRKATANAAKVIMSNLSPHCVRLLLPSVLKGLNDNKWRTKQGSAELLGSMAYCAPKQLSISLPMIIPQLIKIPI
jgi:hypothetical protein